MQGFKIHSPHGELPAGAPPAAPDTVRPWPDELPPPPRKPSPWRWLYVPASLVIGLAVAEPGDGAGARIGYALLMVALGTAIAAGFYIWRKSTRPAIPATTFILVFLFTGGVLADRQAQAEEEAGELQEAAGRFATGLDADDSPPAAVEARIAWASRWALSDVEHHYAKLASERGIDPREHPEAWLSAAYLADAGDHREVRTYFTAYRDYLAEADSSTPEVFAKRYHARLRESGYSELQAQLMAASIPKEAAEAMKMRRDDLQLSARLAASALTLHDHLVQADGRAHYDREKDIARFERNAERRRANTLLDEVQGRMGELETLRAANHALWQDRQREAANGGP